MDFAQFWAELQKGGCTPKGSIYSVIEGGNELHILLSKSDKTAFLINKHKVARYFQILETKEITSDEFREKKSPHFCDVYEYVKINARKNCSEVPNFPTGLDHIEWVVVASEHARQESAKMLSKEKKQLSLLGTALTVLYQGATCHRECSGASHILERMAGRFYNLSCSSYILICRGFYDEALSLVRSMGEIANIISLFVVDKKFLQEWIEADADTRRRKFQPGKIRTLLEKTAPLMLVATDEWYRKLCEDYVHVNPSTKPNVHNNSNQAHIGGIVQDNGLRHTLSELTTITSMTALVLAKIFKLDDLFDELKVKVKGLSSVST